MNENDSLIIEGLDGEKNIQGILSVNGSKNDALQALPAALLFENPLRLENLAEIEDIGQMISLLKNLGSNIDRNIDEHWISIDTRSLKNGKIDSEIAKKLRASIVSTGPLLARTGEIEFPHPGGCVIGERPIDLFLEGFAKMGAKIKSKDDVYRLTANHGRLNGAEIFFRNQTVTGTECFLMAAILAKGKTVLKNCALEPEIVSLGSFLINQGARITGLGTPTITIEGGNLLTSASPVYKIIPDRIEAGSFLILGALTARELVIDNCYPEHLEAVINLLRSAGAEIITDKGQIIIKATESEYRPLNIKTHEYPGFPTDLQAPISILLTQANGESKIFETIFEGRLNYLETLARMGAKISIYNQHQASVVGKTPLNGKSVTSPDLRAGLAYVLAGLIAKGQTVVHNVHYIDRGYERIDKRLSQIGFKISRE